MGCVLIKFVDSTNLNRGCKCFVGHNIEMSPTARYSLGNEPE